MGFAIIFAIILAIVSIIHVANIEFRWKAHKKIKIVTKPLLVPLIILYYILSSSENNLLLIIGLFFGFLGDVFLLDKKDNMRFMGGLVSFLLGHLLYIILFFGIAEPEEGYMGLFIGLIVIYGIYICIFYIKLKPSLKKEKMEIPVIVYSIVLGLMGLSAFLVMKTNSSHFSGDGTLIYIGSILFLISDSVLAWGVFKNEFNHGNSIVMTTYILAQFLIAYGMIF